MKEATTILFIFLAGFALVAVFGATKALDAATDVILHTKRVQP